MRDFLKERGFASAEDTIESFYTLNERVSDGGEYVRVPRDGRMTLDERRAIYRWLGAPEMPDDYDLISGRTPMPSSPNMMSHTHPGHARAW